MSTSLSDRLRRAFGSSLRDTVASPAACGPSDELGIAPSAQQDRDGHQSWGDDGADLPGREIETAAGPCLVYDEHYPLDYLYGQQSLADCFDLPPLALGCLAKRPGLDAVDLRDVVFLDTETTGLAGGTGTSAFLVGLGFFTAEVGARARGEPGQAMGNGAFTIRQFFMRDFGEERALLLALGEALTPFRHVVTFNGKSFDLPLLETRYILARLGRRWQPELHFDLLHPARRLWRERLGSCTLSALEESILGHLREQDVPSWAIPGLYTAYLQRGEARPLRLVFSHNRHDLLSLVALLTQVGRRLAAPLSGALQPDELLAVARLYDELGLRKEACACLEMALEGVGRTRENQMVRRRAQLLLALSLKRAGQRQRALTLWRELAGGPLALTSLIEQAKHFEHHERDPRAALELVEQALDVLELRESRDGPIRWRAERLDLERRLQRLLRKRGGARAPV